MKVDRSYTQCTADLMVAGPLRYNDGSIRELVLLVADGAGTEAFKFDVHITNVNDQPERIWLASPSVKENTQSGILVSELKTDDADYADVMEYTLIDDGGGTFALVGDEIIVKNQTMLDHEARSSVAIIVSATDDGDPPLTGRSTISIRIDDLNEAPADIKFTRDSFFETVNVGSAITRVEVVDPDNAGSPGQPNVQSHVCSITANAGPFSITRNTIKLAKAGVDYERRKQYDNVELTCVDNGIPQLSLTKTLTLKVLNRNELPLFTLLSASSVPENAPSGMIVGVFTTRDPDNAGIEADAAQASFEYKIATIDGFTHCSRGIPDERCKLWIDGATLRTVSPLNYELQPEHVLEVEVTDSGGGKLTTAFTIAVKDTNDVPTSVTLSQEGEGSDTPTGGADLGIGAANTVTEGAAGAVVGQLQTIDEDEGQTHTYAIVDQYMTDGALFAIEGNTTLRLLSDAVISYEQTPKLIVHVKATDNGDPARFRTAKLEVFVEDVNEPPASAFIANSDQGYRNGNVLVNENVLVRGTCVGQITVTDPDNAAHAATLLSSNGGGGGDSGGGDDDGDRRSNIQTHVCTVVDGGTDAGGDSDNTDAKPFFKVMTPVPSDDGMQQEEQLCLAGGVVDFEATDGVTVLSVGLECTDSGTPSLSGTFNVTLEIENGNEPPQGLVVVDGDSSSSSTATTEGGGGDEGDDAVVTLAVNEDARVGTRIGTIIVEDPDNCAAARCYPWQSHTLHIAAGKSDGNGNTTDIGGAVASPFFAVQGTSIIVIKALDYDVDEQHRFTIAATDNGDPSLTTMFTIVVNVGNVAAKIPSVIQLSGKHTITPGVRSGDVVGRLSLNKDAEDGANFNPSKHVYVLKSTITLPGAQPVVPAPFTVVGLELRVNDSTAFHPGSSFAVYLRLMEKDAGAGAGAGAGALVQTTVIVSTTVDNIVPRIDGLAPTYVLPESYTGADHRVAVAGGGGGGGGDDSSNGGGVVATFAVHDPNNQVGCVYNSRAASSSLSSAIACANTHECSVVVTRCCRQTAGAQSCAMVSGDHETCQKGATGDGAQPFAVQYANKSSNFVLAVAATLDYEIIAGYEIEIRCADDGSPPLGAVQSAIITVTDVNEPPIKFAFTDANGEAHVPTVFEGAAEGTFVGSFSSEDPDAYSPGSPAMSYTISSYTDGRQLPSVGWGELPATLPFRVVERSKLVVAGTIDYEAVSHYRIRVTVSDGSDTEPANGTAARGMTSTWTVDVNVGEVNEQPTAIHLNCGCTSMPCWNGGTCMPVGSHGFMCLCSRSFSGRNCELDESNASVTTLDDELEHPTPPSTEVAAPNARATAGEACLHIQPTVTVGSTLAKLNVLDYDFNQVHDVKVIGTASRFLGIKEGNQVYLLEPPPQEAEVSIIAVDNGGLQVVQSFQFRVSECGTNGVCSTRASCTLDVHNQAVCRCNDGFVGNGNVCAEALCGGVLCSQIETCSSSPTPCHNGALCSELDQQQGGVTVVCTCTAGFSGVRCDATPESLCAEADCSSANATCVLNRFATRNVGRPHLSLSTCASAEAVISNLEVSYEDDRQLCVVDLAPASTFAQVSQSFGGGSSDTRLPAVCTGASSNTIAPGDASWPCLSLVAFEAMAGRKNGSFALDSSVAAADNFRVFEPHDDLVGGGNSSNTSATGGGSGGGATASAAVFDVDAARFRTAAEMRADIAAVCEDRHSAAFAHTYAPPHHHPLTTVAVCCGLLRAALLMPDGKPSTGEPVTVVLSTPSPSLESVSSAADQDDAAAASMQVKVSLKVAATAAGGVVVALLLAALLVFIIRRRGNATSTNKTLAVVSRASLSTVRARTAAASDANQHRSKSSISSVSDPPPRRAVAFVNPAYVAAIDGRESPLDGFQNRLARDDDDAGYLNMNDDDGGDDEKNSMGGGYLSIGDEDGSSAADHAVQIPNPLFMAGTSSPGNSPEPANDEPPAVASMNVRKVPVPRTLDQSPATTKSATKYSRSMGSRPPPPNKPRSTTTAHKSYSSFSTVKRASSGGVVRADPRLAAAAAAAVPNDTCTFLATCRCTNCVDYE